MFLEPGRGVMDPGHPPGGEQLRLGPTDREGGRDSLAPRRDRGGWGRVSLNVLYWSSCECELRIGSAAAYWSRRTSDIWAQLWVGGSP